MSMHAVIMAGGSGTRFWPASRRTRPKQLLPLASGRSLIQTTVERVRDLAGPDRTWIVTNPRQLDPMLTALNEFPREQIIVEPEPRDTAPCVALAAAVIEARDPGATMAVMPADHLIDAPERFQADLEQAARLAQDDTTLVTFGIPPTYPATGFGYIELGNALPQVTGAFDVLRFREKPDQTTAQTFLESGQFLWNSGIFVWNFVSLTRAMETACPELAICTHTMLAAARVDDDAARDAAFQQAPRISVDYAVMEKAEHVAVIRATFGWDDLGSFAALGALADRDLHGNITVNQSAAAVLQLQSERCTAYTEGAQTIALFGVRDLIVVNTPDVVLVCPRDRAEDIKEFIRHLQHIGRDDLL
jgi:mannose-1-phosphate guanylyltransferase